MTRKLHYLLNCLLILFLTSAQSTFAQTVKIEKKDELSPEVRKEAVAFLRETMADVGNLRSLENRIGFSSEMASLMWFSDEREGRAMYQTVINDFRQLIARYDALANAASEDGQDENPYMSPFMGGGGRNNPARKLIKALEVRRQIASTLAEHDGQLALDFFADAAQAVTNPKIRKQLAETDSYFETQFIRQVAEQNVETALRLGLKSLEKGFNQQTIDLLRKIYEKDTDKGIAFGESLFQKVKSGSLKPEYYHALGSLLTAGAENFEKIKDKSGKKPMFGEQSLREMTDLLVKELLNGGNEEKKSYASAYIPLIEKFSPAGAMQIRQKFNLKLQPLPGLRMLSPNGRMTSFGAPPPPAPRAINAESRPDAQAQLMESVQSLGSKTLSKEEREKMVASTKKAIAIIKDPTQKLFALGALAAQIAALGDKELAAQILDESKSLVNLQPKNFFEFMQIWMLAGSYAQVDAPKAFPILEDAVMRLNDTLGAFVKVGEFMDVSGEIIEDGEVQVGSFGGSMTRDLLGSLGAADTTVRSLAKADFARTKDLTDKFERPEARILAKMLVLRAVLNDKKLQARDESQP